jgi:hypothetical protein
MKQAKQKWLQDPSEINGDNQNTITLETSRHFRNKKREYLREKLMSFKQTVRTINNIRNLYRGINYFKRDHQPRSNLVKDENCDLLADSIGGRTALSY